MLTRSIGALLVFTFPVLLIWTSAAAPQAADTPVTFTKDVAPILYKNCVSCHRDGEMAPMSLMTYKDARPWAKSIRKNVSERVMPPWHADPAHGTFSNARRLSQAEIDTIVAWVDKGAPQGKPADLPPAPSFPDGWDIGVPDAVFAMTEEFDVPADGVVEYQYFTVQPNFTEDRWIQAAEIKPGNRELVHHVIVFVDEPAGSPSRAPGIKMIPSAPARAAATDRDCRWDRPGRGERTSRPSACEGPVQDRPLRNCSHDAAASGAAARPPPRRAGARSPAGRVPAWKREAHQGRIHADVPDALHAERHRRQGSDAGRPGLRQAAAGQRDPFGGRHEHPLRDPRRRRESSSDVAGGIHRGREALELLPPHARARQELRVPDRPPDGSSQVLLSVPKYDFNWQGEYVLAEPISVPKGTRLECTAYFDNSKANAANPDATKDVRWGDQTWEEMMIGWTTFSVEPTATTTASKP